MNKQQAQYTRLKSIFSYILPLLLGLALLTLFLAFVSTPVEAAPQSPTLQALTSASTELSGIRYLSFGDCTDFHIPEPCYTGTSKYFRFSSRECPICGGPRFNEIVDPINTHSGNFNLEITDISIPTLGQPLRFERTYNSLSVVEDLVVYSDTMGYGWTHTYDLDLTFAAGPYGVDNAVILKAPHGSRMRFTIEGGEGEGEGEGGYGETYIPDPGIWASMVKYDHVLTQTYVITTGNQTVYTFETPKPGQLFTQDTLTANDYQPQDNFGQALAVDGDWMVVGAPSDDTTNGVDAGGVYLYQRNSGGSSGWNEVKKVVAGDGAASDFFGQAVSLSGDTVAVGAYQQDSQATNAGAVYIFQRDQGGPDNWGQVTKITIADGVAEDYFGYSLALDGDTLVVGAYQEDSRGTDAGAAYIFERNQGGTDNWGLTKKITGSDGESGDGFGYSVDIDADRVVVGAYKEDSQGTDAGAAYLFERGQGGANNWGQLKKLISPAWDPQGDEFGTSVGIDDNRIVVGIPKSEADFGSANVFEQNTGGTNSWGYHSTLAEEGGLFGQAVAIEGDRILVGIPGVKNQWNIQVGLVYLYELGEYGWELINGQELFIRKFGEDYEPIGQSVALDGDTVMVGSPLGDVMGQTDAGLVFEFEAYGSLQKAYLTSIRDPQGYLTTMSYTNRRLSRVTGPSGQRWLDLSYNTQGLLDTVADHTGRSVSYQYDIYGNLATVNDLRDLDWTYVYTYPLTLDPATSTYLLHEVIDPDGRTKVKTFFDDRARAIRQEDGAGRVMAEITYPTDPNNDNGIRTMTVNGTAMTDTYDDEGLLINQSVDTLPNQTYTFDDYLNRDLEIDAKGNKTEYLRNDLGQTLAITDDLGNETHYTYDAQNNLASVTDANEVTTDYEYDLNNNLRKVTAPLVGTTIYTYNSQQLLVAMRDARGNVTKYGYDTFGNRTVITDALGFTTRYQYDALNRLERTIDAKGKVTRNIYDDGNNLIQIIENEHPTNVTQNYQDEYNLITTYSYDGAGRRETTTDTLGRVSENIYDAGGQLIQTIQNKHSSNPTQNYQNEYNLITTYGYDEFGRSIAVTDTLNYVSRTFYDTAGRVDRTVTNYVGNGDYNVNHPDQNITTQYVYDDNGNVEKTISSVGAPEERASCTVYDDLNRIKQSIENCIDKVHDGSDGPDEDLITIYLYDDLGNQTAIIDPANRRTDYEYDDLNRVFKITNPLNGETIYTYDAVGNRTQIVNPKSQIVTYDYDALNRVVTTTNHLDGQTVVLYDEVGNRERTIDAEGNVTLYRYDSLYRLEEMEDAENQITRYTYDALGNRRTETDAETRVTKYDYDELNRLTLTTLNFVSGGPSNSDTNVTQAVKYDALSRRLETIDGRGNSTWFGYDGLGRTIAITNALLHVSRTEYDGLGQRTATINAELERTEYRYDGVGRLRFIENELGHIIEYRYNEVGERTVMIDAELTETHYDYDDLGRLTEVIENYEDGVPPAVGAAQDEDLITEYRYDALGNRTMTINARGFATHYRYDGLNRRREMEDALGNITTYGYDRVGNQKVITDANTVVTEFFYDKVYRLTDITYSDDTPDVTFTYNNVGNRETMQDGTGQTTYLYDDLNRLTDVTDGANFQVGYGYDRAGNQTSLTYPGSVGSVVYDYDVANRLDTVTDWNSDQFGYTYDDANRMTGVALPNGIQSDYDYDDIGRLELLTYSTSTETLGQYDYTLNKVGNRTAVTETLQTLGEGSTGAYEEQDGLVVIEGENFSDQALGLSHRWEAVAGHIQALPDVDVLHSPAQITDGPRVDYPIQFVTTGVYTIWLRGSNENPGNDSVYVGLNGPDGPNPEQQVVGLSGFAPEGWSWGSERLAVTDLSATVTVTNTGLYTLSLWMREDGLRVDRLLLTTDQMYAPAGEGPVESARQLFGTVSLTQTMIYTYDGVYRLTDADYSTGATYDYAYDLVGNRLKQIIGGDTTDYLYDAANRLTAVSDSASSTTYTFDDNGNLLQTGEMVNQFDAANRLVETSRDSHVVEPMYNGVNDRVGQTVDGVTTDYALDVQGLPEVIYTSEGNAYLHLPGVIMTESSLGEVRYLLSDALGSVRQVVDETAQVVSYQEFDPYGNALETGADTYGYTGEWWQEEVSLLHLRARWYAPETGTFLSVDPVESEPPYQYVRGNPINLIDPSGMDPPAPNDEISIGPQEAPYFPVLAKLPPSYTLANGLQDFNGYVEGRVTILNVFFCSFGVVGEEIVYDFESRQRQRFKYSASSDSGIGGLTSTLYGYEYIVYGGLLRGFTGNGITNDYEGKNVGISADASLVIPFQGILKGIGVGASKSGAHLAKHSGVLSNFYSGQGGLSWVGAPGSHSGGPGVNGLINYYGPAPSISYSPVNLSVTYTEVERDGPVQSYQGYEDKMLKDVLNGDGSPNSVFPLSVTMPFNNTSGDKLDFNLRSAGAAVGANTFNRNGIPVFVGQPLNTE